MATSYNIYCDESCHLEHDGQPVMLLGAVWCPRERVRAISLDVRQIKRDHGLADDFEIKWTKVSLGGINFYRALIQYFFTTADLHFRGLVVLDKSQLNHDRFPGQDHDLFYYKMYYQLLLPLMDPKSKYRIYIDIKDTRGIAKQNELHRILCCKQRDFQAEVVEAVQQIHSHESNLLQLADLLIGAVSYANRHLSGNRGKEQVVTAIECQARYRLTSSTFLKEEKFNLFHFTPRKEQQ